jgi:antitoxin PrlF
MVVLPHYIIRNVYKENIMQTTTSKLTKKYQATVPETVRKKLELKAGDVIAFDIDDGAIKLRKARPVDIAFSSALIPTLSEWESKNDEEAYHDL